MTRRRLGGRLSIFTMIGMIMLMGLVTKNAILLVDHTNTLRATGRRRTPSPAESGVALEASV